MKTLLLLLITFSASAQYFAPSIVTIYSDNSFYPGLRYGLDVKLYTIDRRNEYFTSLTLAFGETVKSESELYRAGAGIKRTFTRYSRFKYGIMGSLSYYRYYGTDRPVVKIGAIPYVGSTTAIGISPLISYDIAKYFYTEAGMTAHPLQMGEAKAGLNYFVSIGMRWR